MIFYQLLSIEVLKLATQKKLIKKDSRRLHGLGIWISNNTAYGLGNSILLQRISDINVFSHETGSDAAAKRAMEGRIHIDDISWCVPHITPDVFQQELKLEEFVSRTATELAYIKRTVHKTNLSAEKNWSFELGVEKSDDVPFFCFCKIYAKRQYFIIRHKKIIHFINRVSKTLNVL